MNKKFLITILFLFVLSLSLCSCRDASLDKTNPLLYSLSTKKSINILINGDSVASDSSDGAWQNLVARKLNEEYQIDEVFLSNISLPGNAAYGGYAIENLTTLENGEQYDLVILCYGQNDYELSDFPIYYEALIRASKKNNPQAEIITILESAQLDYTEKINTIIKISEHYGISYVDTIQAFKESGFSNEELTTDLVHLNEKGHQIYADIIFDVLKNNVLFSGYEQLKLKKPLNKMVQDYDYFYYIDRNQMSESEDGLSFVVDGKIDTIGIDQIHEPGDNKLTITVDGENLDLGYDWNYSFSQRHINLIRSNDISDSKQTEIILQGDKKNLDRVKGIIVTAAKKISMDSAEVVVTLQRVGAKSISACQTINQAFLDEKGEITSVEHGNSDARNYYIAVYPVAAGKFLEVSSNTIGTVNSIMRYAFFEDDQGMHIIREGSYNTGGWSDSYQSYVEVPEGAKYLFVSSQNNSTNTVKENIEKNISEEIPFKKIYHSKTITADGVMCGSETNKEYNNYSVYLYELEGKGKAIVHSNVIGNPNNFMIFALSDKKDSIEFEKSGVLNKEGWNETPTTWVRFSEKDKFLYVVCQNSSVPVVTIEK